MYGADVNKNLIKNGNIYVFKVFPYYSSSFNFPVQTSWVIPDITTFS